MPFRKQAKGVTRSSQRTFNGVRNGVRNAAWNDEESAGMEYTKLFRSVGPVLNKVFIPRQELLSKYINLVPWSSIEKYLKVTRPRTASYCPPAI